MRGLQSSLSALRQRQKLFEGLLRMPRGMPNGAERGARAARTTLARVGGFGSNPGNLGMLTYVPQRLAASPALVVVLHGCTQTPESYNDGAGWSDLADRHGFVLLFPEQTGANNPKSCFSWFLPEDTARGSGEALSIRQMIERAVQDHGIERSRIFVTGLSAGGAMAAALLATYPELFAAGSIIAGLPYGAAKNVQEALECMFQGRTRSAREWGDLVRAASSHRGDWPRISIWHGAGDHIVKPGNATELVKQWTDLHGLSSLPGERSLVAGHWREVWRDASGREVVESFAIEGMGHGTPLAVGHGEMEGGAAGPFMLDVGLSSSHHIARFFGLLEDVPDGVAVPRQTPVRAGASAASEALDGEILPPPQAPGADGPDAGPELPFGVPRSLPPQVLQVIQNAFAAAGLTKR
jgi:feruloyl esterase